MAEKKGGSGGSGFEGFELDTISHNKRKSGEEESELTRSFFANGPDDGDGLGRHSVNPSKLTPPPPPEKKA